MTIYEIEDVCNILKIGKNTAYELVRKKDLQAFKIHGVWKITDEALKHFIEHSYHLTDLPCIQNRRALPQINKSGLD